MMINHLPQSVTLLVSLLDRELIKVFTELREEFTFLTCRGRHRHVYMSVDGAGLQVLN